MTQVYGEDGVIVPVTAIEAGPCVVTMLRTQERDGYEAVQLGFDDKPRRVATKAERGHVAAIGSKRAKSKAEAGVEATPKPGCEPKRLLREFRTDGEEHGLELGQEVGLGLLEDVKKVDVIGTTKGRGFAGAMKRHNFAGQRATHGVKKVHRAVGSIGQSADPARVIKGTKMAGQYGNARRTVRGLRVVRVDAENNLLLVRGAVPGPNGGYVTISKSNKDRG
ncbi:MAG: 50S ribosomal protein L3 [Planctomycetota bacterium]